MRRDFQRFPEISEISERFRGISRHVYESSVSDGPLAWEKDQGTYNAHAQSCRAACGREEYSLHLKAL